MPCYLSCSVPAPYIAVPAAMRMTVPEANPSFYISTALGLTFPFNILLGSRFTWH